MKTKEKLYTCPKCNKKYSGLKWMNKHLVKLNHGITYCVYYSYDLVKSMEFRLQTLENKLENLDFKNIVMNSSDFAIERIKKEVKPEQNESKLQLTVVIQQLNVIFKTVNPGEHNIKPSEILNIKN